MLSPLLSGSRPSRLSLKQLALVSDVVVVDPNVNRTLGGRGTAPGGDTDEDAGGRSRTGGGWALPLPVLLVGRR